MSISRRSLIASATAVPLLAAKDDTARNTPERRLKVVVTGGHPGDPECGCGGTITRYAAQGHDVVLLYLNRGEGYCGTAKLEQCAAIRTEEARQACAILHARAAFAGQYDGRAVVDNAHYDEFRRQLETEKPDVVFTHWPIDQHRDHRAVSTLTLDAWLKSDRRFALFYYEVADDTMMFSPIDYVDISAAEARKRQACYAHVSQSPSHWYSKQEQITRFRGMESGFAQAEGFTRHWQSKGRVLP